MKIFKRDSIVHLKFWSGASEFICVNETLIFPEILLLILISIIFSESIGTMHLLTCGH